LTRDAVLGALLAPERAAIARRALVAVEAADPAFAGDHLELAADLAETAGDHDRSARLWLEAARRAFERGALGTAQGALERARAIAEIRSGLEAEFVDAPLSRAARDGILEQLANAVSTRAMSPAAAANEIEQRYLRGRRAEAP
jgi:hypothetical protein